jgi:hypothetical protein
MTTQYQDGGDGRHIPLSAFSDVPSVLVGTQSGELSATPVDELSGLPAIVEGDAGKVLLVNETEDGYELGAGAGGVSQQGWRTTFNLEVDLNESTSNINKPDLTGIVLSASSNGLNEGNPVTWVDIDPTYTNTLLFESGTYLIGLSYTFVKQDSLQGATSVDGLDGSGIVLLTRRAGFSTNFDNAVLLQKSATWDTTAVTNESSISVVSFPSDINKRRLGLDFVVNVTDPTFFVHATAVVDITRLG